MPINGVGITAALIGGVLVFSGIKGTGVSTTARSFLAGESPVSAAGNSPVPGSGSGDPIAGNTTIQVTGNRATGQLLASAYGWSLGNEWTCLDQLWTRESGWNNTAKNPSSGAYGIAQALPETKYSAAGQESGGSSAAAQISWGLAYIKSRYGSPSAAWAHETANNWY